MSFTGTIDALVGKLRRVTSSSLFIPEIDGLRFLAIFLVVMYHISGEVVLRAHLVIAEAPLFYIAVHHFFNNGFKGVQLFFAISGFVLALPFAKHFIKKEKSVNIKNYFLKRLTRIEPPYILSILAGFFYLAVKGMTAWPTLWSSLLAALFYLNNNFQIGSTLNGVAWSLEIEVQFYILAPLIFYVFALPKIARRVLLLSLMVAFPLLHSFYLPHIPTLYHYIQYFLVGILLADFYISGVRITLPKTFSIIAGAVIFFVMMQIGITSVIGEITFLLSILLFYFLVLNDGFWKKLFSIKYLTAIGGMCYSIYLWHYFIIDAVMKLSMAIKKPGDYLVTLGLQSIILLSCVLVFSTIFYLLIEKPCMDKDWPKKLARFFFSRRVVTLD